MQDSDPSPPVVIVGLDHYLGLQSARILAGWGVSVFGVVRDKKHFCRYTNVCEEILVSDTLSEELIDELKRTSISSRAHFLSYILVKVEPPGNRRY